MASVSTDTRLRELRNQWDAKDAEANLLIADPGVTSEMITKAEQLQKQRDALGKEIEERIADIGRLDLLQKNQAGGQAWMNTPARGLPFSSEMGGSGVGNRYEQVEAMNQGRGFKTFGFDDAGASEYKWDPARQHYVMVKEAGAGLLNKDKVRCWDAISQNEYKTAWFDYLRKGNRGFDLHWKILQEGLDDQGGVLAPAEMIARIIGRLPAPTSLRGLVTTMTTGRDKLIIPRTQYSADDQYSTAFRVTWTGEIPSDSTGALAAINDANLLGNVEVQVYTAMMNGAITRDMIEDGSFPIQSWLETKLAETADLTYEDMILNGSTGTNTTLGNPSGQPVGILFGAAAGNAESNTYPEVILTSTAAGIDYGSFVDMETAVAPQYEGNSRWVYNKRSTRRALMKLVDSQNRPLFTMGYGDSGMVGARGNIVLGYESTLSQFMPNIGASNFPVIFGDLRGHYIAQRIGMSIQVLDQTRAKANQIELVARLRFGGRTLEPWRLKIMKSNNS